MKRLKKKQTGRRFAGLRTLLTLVRKLALRAALVLVGLQLIVIGILALIDIWRKRYRSQGRFPRSMLAEVTIGHSEVQIYTYGEDLYEAMLQAIREGRERIFFETFIWKNDPVGQRFKQELQHAADRGVEVYLIYDSFANLVVPRHFKQFQANLAVLRYPLFAWLRQPFYLSGYARDHRKVLVVDGKTAFVGGYNIGAPYATEWRDTHVRIQGSDAREFESICIDFWNTYRKRDPRQPIVADTNKRDWDPLLVVHRNDPHLLVFPIRNAYLEAINRATSRIYLTHAYFIPDRIILHALLHAAERGVEVNILLPATSNHILADWLARGYYSQCLAGGMRFFLYQNAMVHAKTATIDGNWSMIGTANLDRLSMLGNFEINVEIHSDELAAQMENIFERDVTNTRELTLAEWERRAFLQIFVEKLLLPLRPLL